MMYSEFVEGTGCRENDHNYGVYKNLEVMYMHTDMTKEQIYEYGKNLVDNSLSKEQLEWNEGVDKRIGELKERLESYKQRAEMDRESAKFWRTEYTREGYASDKEMWQMYKDSASVFNDLIRQTRTLIKEAKAMRYV